MLPQNIEFTPEEERIIDEVDQELDKQFWRELGLPEPPSTELPKEEEQQPRDQSSE